MILQAPPPSQRPGLTASQWLYREYLAAKENRSREKMQAAKHSLVSISKVACGRMRPHWSTPVRTGSGELSPASKYALFYVDAWRDRVAFAKEFVNGEIKRGMTMEEARYIGRRCRLRLIDQVRLDTGFYKARRVQTWLKVLDTVRHLPGHDKDHLWKRIRSCKTRKEASNTAIAHDWYRSEGWVRKLRKRLASHLWSIAENDEQRQALKVLRLKP